MFRLWAWAFLAMGTGSKRCRDKGSAHAWVLPSSIQPASASETRELGRTPMYQDTEAAHLKKFPWVVSRARLSENTNCRKAQKANTEKRVPGKKMCTNWFWIKRNCNRNLLTPHIQNCCMNWAKPQSPLNLECVMEASLSLHSLGFFTHIQIDSRFHVNLGINIQFMSNNNSSHVQRGISSIRNSSLPEQLRRTIFFTVQSTQT